MSASSGTFLKALEPLTTPASLPRSSISPSQRRGHLASFETGFPYVVDDEKLHLLHPTTKPELRNSAAVWSMLWSNCAISFTLLMSAIGAGTLAVPYTFVLLSPAVAVVTLCLVGLAMAFTADIILRVHVAVASDSGHEEMRETYQELAMYAGGVRLANVVGFLTAFAVFGACVGCIRVVRDMVPTLMAIFYFHDEDAFSKLSAASKQEYVTRTVWIVFLLVVLPLGFYKKISALRFSSYLGFAFSIYLVGAMAYRAAVGNDFSAADSESDHPLTSMVPSESHFGRISEAIGIYNFTFMLHLNVIPLLAQLVINSKTQDPNNTSDGASLRLAERKMRFNVYGSVLVCVLLYATFGLCAASIYGSSTQGNILLNLQHDPIMVIPRIAILFTILFSFPLLFHPLRSLVLEMRCCGNNPTTTTQLIVSVLLLVAQIICATRVPGIQVVFSFVGSSILLLLCYVLPVVFYIRLAPWQTTQMGIVRMAILSGLAVIATVFCTMATLKLII